MENKNIKIRVGGYRLDKWIMVCFETHYGENDRLGLLCDFNHGEDHDIQVIIPEGYYHMLAVTLGDRYHGGVIVVEAPNDHTLMISRTYSILVVNDMIDPLAFEMPHMLIKDFRDAIAAVLGDKFQ